MANRTTPLIEQVQQWADAQERWQQCALAVLARKATLDANDIDRLYQAILFDNGLADEDPFPEFGGVKLTAGPARAATEIIGGIFGVTGVNALAEGETLEFGTRLTIVYGPNASGKSGYTRVLRHVCQAPGDHPPVYANVYEGPPKQQSAQIVMRDHEQEEEHTVRWTPRDQETKLPASYFDSSTAQHYLRKTTPIRGPRPIRLLTRLAELISQHMRPRFEQAVNQAVTEPRLPDVFRGDTEVGRKVRAIRGRDDLEGLREHVKFSECDRQRLTHLQQEREQLENSTLQEQKERLSRHATQIAELIEDLTRAREQLCAQRLNDLREHVRQREGLDEAIAQAERRQEILRELPAAGTPQRHEFLRVARAVAGVLESDRHRSYPEEGDRCLFCNQRLTDQAVQLIEAYWAHLEDDATVALKKWEQRMRGRTRELEDLDLERLTDEQRLTALPEDTRQILREYARALRKRRNAMLRILAEEHTQADAPSLPEGPEQALRGLLQSLREQHANIDEEALRERKTAVTRELRELEERKKVASYWTRITQYAEQLERKRVLGDLRPSTTEVTREVRQLQQEAMATQYQERFAAECEKLSLRPPICPTFKGRRGETLRELKLTAKQECNPHEVLSEGEQKVAALADFLAEVSSAEDINTIVLDDPVTSLDARFTRKVAERLVEEAEKRQVIIFTHSLSFLARLYESIHESSLPLPTSSAEAKVHWMQSIAGHPGVVSLDQSPNLEKRFTSAQPAREALNAAHRSQGNRRQRAIRRGFGIIRTICECVTVRKILSGVVRPLDDYIRIRSLRSMRVDSTVISQLIKIHQTASDHIEGHWRTDRRDDLPDCTDLEAVIQELEDLLERLDSTAKLVQD